MSIYDYAREYLRDHAEEAGATPGPALDRWLERQTDLLGNHLRTAVEGFVLNMDPPPIEDA